MDESVLSSESISIGGKTFAPQWINYLNLPRYFWDESTKTLGLDGDWIDVFDHYASELCDHSLQLISNQAEHLFLGDNFRTNTCDACHTLTSILSKSLLEKCDVIVSSQNEFCKIVKGIIMTSYDWVLPVYPICGDGLYRIPVGGKWGIFDREGNQVVPCKYDSIWSFDDNGLCMVRIDDENGYLYGYVNKEGVEQIPVEYDHLYSFDNGVTVAEKGGLYGIIDEGNNIIHPFDMNYEDMRGLCNGYATMKDANGKWGAIDAKGNVVVPCLFDSLVVFDERGIADVKQGGCTLNLVTDSFCNIDIGDACSITDGWN